MKTSFGIPLFIFISLFSLQSQSQTQLKTKKPDWRQWYDSAAFFNAKEPLIVGFGDRSEELSKAHDNRMIFEHAEKYYSINCLADYYFWFTRKYEFLFKKEISIYEEHYYAGNILEQAKFIKKQYTGKELPVKFKTNFPPNKTNWNQTSADTQFNPDRNRPNTDYSPRGIAIRKARRH